jgi:cell division protein FtsZ
VSLRGAKAVIINITGGEDLGLMEVEEAAQHIREMVDPDANIIVGSAFNDDLNGKMRVSVVATGIEGGQQVISSISAAQPRPSAGAQIFGARPQIVPPAAPGAGEIDPTQPFGGGGGFRPQTSPTAGPMVDGIFGTPAGTFRPAAADEAPTPGAEPASDSRAAQDASLSDEDMMELGDPVEAELDLPVPAPAPSAAELPLAAPARLELPEAERRAPLPEPVQRRQTLFERMMHLSRKPKGEEPPVETLAPEPEADPVEDETRIPPFMRRQHN